MVLAPFVNYNMDAIFPFCAEAAHHEFNSHRKRDRLPGPKALQHAMPIISQTYQTYLLNSELSNALLEDSTNRFLRVSLESFSIPELRNAVQLFVSSVQRARNIATF